MFEEFDIGKKIYVVAEIGINHNGDIQLAKELIDIACSCKCDAVKFQKREIDLVYSKKILDSFRESPWGKTQRDQKEGLEFSIEEYDEIDAYCKNKDIDWFVSSWDTVSQEKMRKYNFKCNKIASAMATNLEFLECVASEKRPTFISTGMTTLEEVDNAVNIFKKYNCEFMLLHTVSTYPAKESDLNLNCIKTLRERYGVSVGYSGHEATVSPSIVAASLGATVIERHITLDRAMYGSDQAASLQKDGLEQLVNALQKIPLILGDGKKKILKEELDVSKKLRYWRK